MMVLGPLKQPLKQLALFAGGICCRSTRCRERVPAQLGWDQQLARMHGSLFGLSSPLIGCGTVGPHTPFHS